MSSKINKTEKKQKNENFLRKINEMRNDLFGQLSSVITKETKRKAWDQVKDYAILIGLISRNKDYTYVRDVIWPHLRNRTMMKIHKSRKTREEFNECDKLVIEIIGKESPLISILSLKDSIHEVQQQSFFSVHNIDSHLKPSVNGIDISYDNGNQSMQITKVFTLHVQIPHELILLEEMKKHKIELEKEKLGDKQLELCQLSFDKVKASCGQKNYKPFTMQTYKGVRINEDEFGCFNDPETGTSQVVRRFTLTNENGLSVQIINYGGIITSIKAPDGNQQIDDLVLGFDNIQGYLDTNNPYFGAVIGRVANRIANASFTLNGQEYHVGNNAGNGSYTLHGGFRGFDKYLWEPFIEENKLTLSRVSKDGEEGFPGDVLVQAIYQLTNDNELSLEFKATSSKPTPINLCNHAYFNLAGHKTGAKGVYEHIATINADRYTVTNEMIIPTGEIASVEGTILDLRKASLLGDKIPQVPGGGYDHNLCVIQSDPNGINLVARVVHPESKRYLEVRSNQPGVQFYTSNSLPNNTLVGKDGVTYETHGAFCLETQNYPNAINIPTFPNSVLNPGNNYYHIVIYKFGVVADNVKGK